MCGLFGWIQNETTPIDERSAMTIVAAVLAIENDRRGGDSWGFWDRQNVVKGLGKISDCGEIFSIASKPYVLGHTRQATTGKVIPENSHPFTIGPIVGAHNGMVTNHRELQTKYQRAYDVDSQHIFAHMAEGKPLSEIDAYGAIVADYPADHVTEIGRFNSGVLSLVQTPIGWIWSSEQSVLMRACKIARVEIVKHYQLGEGKRYRLTGAGIVKAGKLSFSRASFGYSVDSWEDYRDADKPIWRGSSAPRSCGDGIVFDCPSCDGHGIDKHMDNCLACHGTGEICEKRGSRGPVVGSFPSRGIATTPFLTSEHGEVQQALAPRTIDTSKGLPEYYRRGSSLRGINGKGGK